MNHNKHLILSIVISAIGMIPAAYAQKTDLLSLYQSAIKTDPALLKSAAELESSKENGVQAISSWLPNITANASITRNQSKGYESGNNTSRSNTAGIALQQTIYDHQKYLNLGISDLGIEVAKANYEISKQNLIQNLTTAYFEVLMAADNVTLSKTELVAITRQLEQAKQRYDVGIIAITEVLNAQAGYDSTQASLIKAENDYQVALARLQEASGTYSNNLAGLVDKFPLNRPQPDNVNAWNQKSIRNNLSLQILNHQLQSAKKNLQLQRAGHYPSLSLQASYQTSDSKTLSGDQSSIFSQFNSRSGNDSSISLNLSLPIYQGGKVFSKTRQANYQIQQTEQEKKALLRSLRSQTTTSYLQIISSISQVKALKQAVISNQSSLESTEAGFEAGTRTIVDVLNVQRDLYAAQRNYSAARYAYLNALIQLKLAVGTLSEKDLKEINQWLKK